jgi:hypothetical protein
MHALVVVPRVSKMHVMGGCNCSLAFVAVTLQER